MEYEGGVAAVEKSGDNYYYEFFPWKKATSLEVEGSSHTVNIGDTLQLTPVTNGTKTEVYSWKSSDPKIASINRAGQVFGWSKGEAVITVSTTSGLSAQCTVTVTGEPSVQDPDKTATVTDGYASNNHSLNDYAIWSKTVNSYLIPNADGTFTRVEHCGGKMIVENYSAAGKKTGSKTVAMELSLFGGFYSGSDHNYFVFGQANPNDSDEEEVMRIVKYSKDFQRIGAVSVYGANTNIPFEAGSLRMTETAGKLYIHTCHEMYTDSDGLNHQANMTFVINENDMSVEQSYYDVLNLAQAGYVSHSFNQFIQTDGENIYRVDHGDYAPRGIALIKSQVGGSITKVDYAIPVGLGKVTEGHYNSTGASVGGFEISSENCIIAGNAVDFESERANTSDQRNIFISITDKQLGVLGQAHSPQQHGPLLLDVQVFVPDGPHRGSRVLSLAQRGGHQLGHGALELAVQLGQTGLPGVELLPQLLPLVLPAALVFLQPGGGPAQHVGVVCHLLALLFHLLHQAAHALHILPGLLGLPIGLSWGGSRSGHRLSGHPALKFPR